MIYLDTSVALAHLLAEDRRPSGELWAGDLVSSRLTQYETMNRLHARSATGPQLKAARDLLDRIHLIALLPAVLARALDPFPVPVRTLDALHLASMAFLHANGQSVELASYDERLNAAAAMGFEVLAL